MAEFLQVGDLHTTDASGSGGLSKYVEDPDAMVVREVEKVLEYGRRKGVHTMLLPGDLCDNPRMSYQAQHALIGLFDRNKDFQFHIIPGNHDMFSLKPSGGHSLEILNRIYLGSSHVHFYFKPKTTKLDGVNVRFLLYPHVSFNGDSLNVFHNEVHGARNDAGRTFDSDELSKSKAVAVGGHLHTAHRVRNTFFSGTLYQTNFGERLPKYFHHIEFNSAQDFEINLVKHKPEYTLHNVVLQSRDDLKDIPRELTSLVKLVIQDGADVSAADFTHLTNVVEHKNFKTKEDLASVLTEDLSEGQEVTFRVSDFFSVWVEAYDVSDELRDRIKQTRRRVLNSARSK